MHMDESNLALPPGLSTKKADSVILTHLTDHSRSFNIFLGRDKGFGLQGTDGVSHVSRSTQEN